MDCHILITARQAGSAMKGVPVHGADAYFDDFHGHDELQFPRYMPKAQDWLTEHDYMHKCIHGFGGWSDSIFSSRPVKR